MSFLGLFEFCIEEDDVFEDGRKKGRGGDSRKRYVG